MHALPNGAAYYKERLANQTTTTLTADEIHQIGLAEVARLRGEMEAIKNEVGFKGDLPAFFAELRDNKDNPRYYYPNTDEGRQAYIKDATAAIDKIKAVLPKYFGILPKADLVVKRVEPFREQPGAAQHYFPSTPDGSRPGVYYAHLLDMKAMPKHELEVIAYHEGLPGHHMQISIAQELKPCRRSAGRRASPRMRKAGGSTPSGWRARCRAPTRIRIRVSAGSARRSGAPSGWSSTRACTRRDGPRSRRCSTSSPTPRPPKPQARSEIRRYMVLPGQATSYKIGMLKIQELRRKAEGALGTPLRHPRVPRHGARRRRAAADGAREARRSLDRRRQTVDASYFLGNLSGLSVKSASTSNL